MSICAELPDHLFGAPQPFPKHSQPHSLRCLPCLLFSIFALTPSPPHNTRFFLEAPDRGYTPWRYPGLLGPWPHKMSYLSVGSLKGTEGAAPATTAAQGRHFCHVTAVKNETCASGQGKHTLLSPRAPLCHKLSLTHPQRAQGVCVLAGGLSWVIGEITACLW